MRKAVGIGGVFFRAADPAKLAAWYAEHLGVDAGSDGSWRQEAGPTVFAPFRADSDYFPADRPWMINFRVADLDALVAALAAAGIEAGGREESEFGRFARIHDPEGNPIELWEPPPEG